jgi:LysR family nitrogen assimilation transcriptional regulator
MDTRHLRSFLRIAELRSISRAAESLGIAQPSLSQQVLRLEDEVGFKLFRRTPRGVMLTEAGRIFQEHARNILRSIEQAQEDMRQLTVEAAGQVVFAMPPSISKLIGVPLIEAVIAHAPHVSLRLVEAFSGTIFGWLDTAKIDLGILHDRGSLRRLSARRLVSEEMFLIGPAGRFGDSVDDAPAIPPQALADLPLIAPGPQHGLRTFLDREAAQLGFTYRISHEIDAVGNIAALVAAGHGFSILPLPAVAEDIAAGRLSVARIGEGTMRRTLHVVRNPTQVVTHASVVVEDLTVRIMAELIDSGRWQARLEAEPD